MHVRNVITSTDSSLMYVRIASFLRQVVYKFMRPYMFYIHGCNLVCKKILDLKLYNNTIIGSGFHLIPRIIKALVMLSTSASSFDR